MSFATISAMLTPQKRIVSTAAFVGLVVFVCLSAGKIAAQENCPKYNEIVNTSPPGCLLFWSWNSLPDPNAPSTMVCCNPGGIPFGESCVARLNSCGAPPDAPQQICLKCLLAGRPIDLTTGNTYISESDLKVPGLGGGLALTRTWNSVLPANQGSYPFMFGSQWRSTYEERLIFNDANGYVEYLRSDGSIYFFGVYQTGSPVVYKASAPAFDTTTTITNGSPYWTVTFKNGEKRQFDATTGALAAIIDRNGNTTTLTYDASQRLTTVTDAAARHLTFNYPDSTSTLVSSVTSDVGLSLSYSYDAQGRLVQVTKPDSTTIHFAYDAQNLITEVTDSEGKLLESHTYDVSGRGLSSSRANGVDSVTVTYPQ